MRVRQGRWSGVATHLDSAAGCDHQPLDGPEAWIVGPAGLDPPDGAGGYTGACGELALAQVGAAAQSAQRRTEIHGVGVCHIRKSGRLIRLGRPSR